MVSKGVDYYFYVTGSFGGITASAENSDGSSAGLDQTFEPNNGTFYTGSAQLNYNISATNMGLASANFEWSTATSPQAQGLATINTITGNLVGGNLLTMMDTTSIIEPQFAISYGFYDSGPGYGDLTDQDQIYAYLTPSMADWMGQLSNSYPDVVNSAPFNQFVLPGAHDCGTFDLTTVNSLLTDGAVLSGWLGCLSSDFFPNSILEMSAGQIPTAVTNLAVTQKDNITTMLNLGCRFFDFRPGYPPAPLNTYATDIYHIHTVIPGYPFESFLTDVIQWLDESPTEIVVVFANNQGFYQPEIMTPSDETLSGILADVQTATGTSIVVGSSSDLATSYGDLISSNTRLIFLNSLNSGSDWYPASYDNSYSDTAYATTTPESVIEALSSMNTAGQGADFTLLQLQGTATNTSGSGVVSCCLSQSNSSSPLMSTKALFDSTTYPWALDNVNQNLQAPQLVVLLNDFFDNALTQTASAITLQRMNLS